MIQEKPSQMSFKERQQVYKDIFQKYQEDPSSLEQLDGSQGRAVQEVCEAGPEIFAQWLEDHEEVWSALRDRYKRGFYSDHDAVDDNYIGEDLNAIASQGPAVWNCWQLEKEIAARELEIQESIPYPLMKEGLVSHESLFQQFGPPELATRELSSGTLNGIIYLHNLSYKNFSGFHFYQPVQVEGNMVREVEEISFHKTVFKGNVEFINLQYIGIINFTEVEFRQAINFKKSLFNVMIFNKIKFLNDITFSTTTFSGDLSFIQVQFFGTVSFNEEVEFIKDVKFEKANFHSTVYFNKIKFNTYKPINKTIFSKVEFYDTAEFENIRFNGDVDFFNFQFRKDSLFRGVKFCRNVRFFGDTDSSGCGFHGKLGFEAFKGETKTSFFKAPQFDVELPRDTGIMEAEFLGLDGSDDSRRAYRTLKLEFSRRQAVREEQFFYHLEIQEEQEQLKNQLEKLKELNRKRKLRKIERKELREKRWRWRFLQIYGAVANYGLSIRGPFWGLLGVFALWAMIYWISTYKIDQSFPQNVKNALAISASYTLPPLMMEWRVKEIIPKLFVSSSSNSLLSIVTPVIWYALLVLQRSISLALWFFVFLYWRNLAKNK